MSRVEFFFDCMSPYSYLASTRVEAMVSAAGGTVQFKPVYLPGLLRAAGNKGPAEIPAKAAYVLKDLADWARALELPPVQFPEVFPFNAALADRCALLADAKGRGNAFGVAMLAAIWRDGRDANDPAVLTSVLESVGLDAKAVLEQAGTDELKTRLRTVTDEAAARGAFGVPTFFVGDEMFVGNDRLDFVVEAVRRATSG